MLSGVWPGLFALAFLVLAGFVVDRLAKQSPRRLARVLLTLAVLLGALPPILAALRA